MHKVIRFFQSPFRNPLLVPCWVGMLCWGAVPQEGENNNNTAVLWSPSPPLSHMNALVHRVLGDYQASGEKKKELKSSPTAVAQGFCSAANRWCLGYTFTASAKGGMGGMCIYFSGSNNVPWKKYFKIFRKSTSCLQFRSTARNKMPVAWHAAVRSQLLQMSFWALVPADSTAILSWEISNLKDHFPPSYWTPE